MKSNQFLLLPAMFLLFLTACSTTPPDTGTNVYEQWRLLNDSSFAKMRDSTTYTHFTIPTERGGSSFYYKINIPGDPTSVSPLASDTIVANYRGSYMNGYVFQQSFKGDNPKKDSTAKPFQAAANQLIRGWTENLMQMKIGEYRTIVIPQELGYGIAEGRAIPPYSTLKFDIQLVAVKRKIN